MLSKLALVIAIPSLFVSAALFAPPVSISLPVAEANLTVSVKAPDQQLICPGAAIRSGGSSGTEIARLDSVGKTELYYSALASGDLEVREIQSNRLEIFPLAAKRLIGKANLVEAAELRISNSEDNEQGALALSANEQQLIDSGSLRGLLASPCSQPSSSFWLLGGSTITGRESILKLINPSPIDATADLRIFTDLGEQLVSGLSGISVLANSETLISIASFAPSAASLAIQVQSQGAKLAGYLQHKIVRGTSAQGISWIGPSNFVDQLVIPGLVIRGSNQIRRLLADEPDIGHQLKLFSPIATTVTVQVIASDPEVFGAVFTKELEANVVETIAIDELKDGNYSVFISASEPLLASLKIARIDRTQGAIPDFGYLVAADPTDRPLLALPTEEGVSVLMIANPQTTAAEVSIEEFSGNSDLVRIAPGESISLEITEPTVLRSQQPIRASLVFLREGKLAAAELIDNRNSGSSVLVSFR